MGIYYTDESGAQKPIYLASYGIGITRVMGVIVEKFADDKGIVWPESVAPAKVYLARLGEEAEVITKADELESVLTAAGIAVLYDDRDERPGKKFADAELLGIPYRVVVSSKTISGAGYELKQRTSETVEQLSLDDLVKKLAA
jgi:prolyl-tRNA synthetase